MANKKHIYSLTSLRLFAVTGVSPRHLGVLKTVDDKLASRVARHFFSGCADVTFFHTLLGFIMSFSYSKHKKDGLSDSKDFIFSRVCRIFPVHILTLLISSLIFPSGLVYGTKNITKSLLNPSLIHVLIPFNDTYFSYDMVGQSLSCELFFYCPSVPLVALKIRALIIILISILSLQFFSLFNPQSFTDEHRLFYTNPIFCIVGFTIGMLFFRPHDEIKVFPKFRMRSFLEIMSSLSPLSIVYIPTNLISNMNVCYDLFFLPSMSFMVLIFSSDNGTISRLLSNKCLVLLGEAPFSFYMIHLMVIRVVFKIGVSGVILDTKSTLILSFFAFLLSVLCSFFLFNYFKRPANKKLRSLWLRLRY